MEIRLLKHGHFYTGDRQQPWTEALALAGERIIATGAAAHAWAAAPHVRVEDLDGALVLPGLVDAHVHLMWYALSLAGLELRDLSREALLAAVAQRAAATPPATWIQGRGWDQNLWAEPRFPTAAELDRAAPHHPVLLIAKSAHAAVANTLALRLAGLEATAADPAHGRFGRTASGALDGMLFEDAMGIVEAAIPAPTAAQVAAALRAAQPLLLQAGLTGVHDVDGGPAFAALQLLHQEGALQLRVVKYVRLEALDAALEVGLRSGYGDDWLRFGGLKLFADGALGSRTGALFEPYVGEPENTGLLTLEPEVLRDSARRAVAGGLALAVHAIGDRANQLVLDVLEEVRPLDRGLRHRIEHVQLLRPQDVPRLAQLGVVASMQPIHAPHDRVMAEQYWGERCRLAYAWRSVLQTGATLAFGSDAPIETFDPLLGIYAAVTRRHERDGAPGPEGWQPQERLTLAEAIEGFTGGAAYASGQERYLGRLLPGYLADLVVLDRDIFAAPPEALLETRVQRVMVGGEWRYAA